MNQKLRNDCDEIVKAAITAVQPDAGVLRALQGFRPHIGRLYLVAVGKAAWQMAKAASQQLSFIEDGIVITKYGNVEGDLPGIRCYEAGHPVPDENGFSATEEVLKLCSGLTENDDIVFLLSGGGSALFEKPLIPGQEMQSVTNQLLAAGASITEINTIRKRLSAVKGGRFAQAAAPAHIYSIILSDIIGDPVDMIASGPACPDSTTCAQAQMIAEKYNLELSEEARKCLAVETPKELDNVITEVTGSVRELCIAAADKCRALGYEPMIVTDRLECEARKAGAFLAAMVSTCARQRGEGEIRKLAVIAGGETVVHITGTGLGGRNQEIALSAAPGIAGLADAAVFSVGSDGTDGPTDAAGGYVDGDTVSEMTAAGIDPAAALNNNDSYNALKAVGGLIMTGPTGTNVNDVAVALLR